MYDPYSKFIKTRFGKYFSEETLENSLKWADCIIIVTDHDKFKFDNETLNMINDKRTVLVDTRNVLNLNIEEDLFHNLVYIKL